MEKTGVLACAGGGWRISLSVYFSPSQTYFLLTATHSRPQTRRTAARLLIRSPEGNRSEASQLFSMKVNCFSYVRGKRLSAM